MGPNGSTLKACGARERRRRPVCPRPPGDRTPEPVLRPGPGPDGVHDGIGEGHQAGLQGELSCGISGLSMV